MQTAAGKKARLHPEEKNLVKGGLQRGSAWEERGRSFLSGDSVQREKDSPFF